MSTCPMCGHRAHRAFRCKVCDCELDAIEAYDAGGPDIDFYLPRGSPEREALENEDAAIWGTDLTLWEEDEQ